MLRYNEKTLPHPLWMVIFQHVVGESTLSSINVFVTFACVLVTRAAEGITSAEGIASAPHSAVWCWWRWRWW